MFAVKFVGMTVWTFLFFFFPFFLGEGGGFPLLAVDDEVEDGGGAITETASETPVNKMKQQFDDKQKWRNCFWNEENGMQI